jgi:hypothetical protein
MPRSTDVPVPPREVSGDGRALLDRLRRLAPAHPSSPAADARSGDGGELAAWRARMPRLQEGWQAHQDRWPRTSDADRPGPSLGLDASTEQRLSAAIDKIKEAAGQITDKMLSVEAEDPSRHLVGLECCLKGGDRIREKVVKFMRQMPSLSPDEAVALVPDSVRYTLQYQPTRYCDGVRADMSRLLDAGFEPVKVKNYWPDREYKGINSQWRDRATGQRFEVQFHTEVSRAAKEFTHEAYRRLRGTAGETSRGELRELHAFQGEVAAAVRVPHGADVVPNYP